MLKIERIWTMTKRSSFRALKLEEIYQSPGTQPFRRCQFHLNLSSLLKQGRGVYTIFSHAFYIVHCHNFENPVNPKFGPLRRNNGRTMTEEGHRKYLTKCRFNNHVFVVITNRRTTGSSSRQSSHQCSLHPRCRCTHRSSYTQTNSLPSHWHPPLSLQLTTLGYLLVCAFNPPLLMRIFFHTTNQLHDDG